MSVSSIGSSSQQAYLPSLGQSSSSDSMPSADGALQALYQAYSDDSSSISSSSTTSSSSSTSSTSTSSAGDDSSTTTNSPRLSSDVLSALFSLQGGQGNSTSTVAQSIFDKFDSDSDGAIDQTELESAIGSDADKTKVDGLFKKLDTNGDGVVSQSELKPALNRVLGGHPLEHMLSAARNDGTTVSGSTTTASDGSSSTDTGTATAAASGLMAELNRLLQQLSNLSNPQSRTAASTTNLTV